MVTSSEHTVSAFDNDINQLHLMVAKIGGLAETAISGALHALATHDTELANKIVAQDPEIDKLELEIEKKAIQIIALRSPVADDLRDVIAAIKIAGVVERIGDYAKNIAKRIVLIESPGSLETLSVLLSMGEIAGEMLSDVLNAFAACDPDAALAVSERDKDVDNFYNSIFRTLITFMMESPKSISLGTQLLFIARNLERIGDHTTNIAEMVYYTAKGEFMPEREKPTHRL